MNFLNNALDSLNKRGNTDNFFVTGQKGSSSPAPPPQGSGLFGGIDFTSSNPSQSIHQQTTIQPDQNPLNAMLFDNTSKTNTDSFFLRKQDDGQQKQPGGLFGNTSGQSGGIFGQSTTGESQGLFGKSGDDKQSGSLFGNISEQSRGIFGQSTTGESQGLFGKSGDDKQSGSLFGNTSGQSGGIFGQGTTGGSQGLFGKPQTGSIFGQSGSFFGKDPTSETKGLFDTTKDAHSLFGKPANNISSGSSVPNIPSSSSTTTQPFSALGSQQPVLNTEGGEQEKKKSIFNFLGKPETTLNDTKDNDRVPSKGQDKDEEPKVLDAPKPQNQDESMPPQVFSQPQITTEEKDEKDEKNASDEGNETDEICMDISFLGKKPSGPSIFGNQESNMESVFNQANEVKPIFSEPPPASDTSDEKPIQLFSQPQIPAEEEKEDKKEDKNVSDEGNEIDENEENETNEIGMDISFLGKKPSGPSIFGGQESIIKSVFDQANEVKPIFSEPPPASSTSDEKPIQLFPQQQIPAEEEKDDKKDEKDETDEAEGNEINNTEIDISFLGKKPSGQSIFGNQENNMESVFNQANEVKPIFSEPPSTSDTSDEKPIQLFPQPQIPAEEEKDDKKDEKNVSDEENETDEICMDISFLGKKPSGQSIFGNQENNMESVFNQANEVKPIFSEPPPASDTSDEKPIQLFSQPQIPAEEEKEDKKDEKNETNEICMDISFLGKKPSGQSIFGNQESNMESVFSQANEVKPIFSEPPPASSTSDKKSIQLFPQPQIITEERSESSSSEKKTDALCDIKTTTKKAEEPKLPQNQPNLFGGFSLPPSKQKPSAKKATSTSDNADSNYAWGGNDEWSICNKKHTEIVAYCKACKMFQCDECALKCMNADHQLVELSAQASEYKRLLTTVKEHIEKRNVELKLGHLTEAASIASASIDEYFDRIAAEVERCRALAKRDLQARKEEYTNSLSLEGASTLIAEIDKVADIDPKSGTKSMIELLIRGSSALKRLRETPNLLMECEDTEEDDNSKEEGDNGPMITFKASLKAEDIERIVSSRIFLRPYLRVMRVGVERLQVSVRPPPRGDESIEVEYEPAEGSEIGGKKSYSSKEQTTIVPIDPHTPCGIRARIIGGAWHSEWSDTVHIDTERRWERCDGFEMSDDGRTITKTRKDTTYIPARVAWKVPEGVVTRWTFKVVQTMRNRIALGVQAIPFTNGCCALFSCEGGHVSNIPPHGKTFAVPRRVSGSANGKILSVLIDLRDRNFAALTFEMDGKSSCNIINIEDVRKNNLCLIAYMSNCGDSLTLENVAEDSGAVPSQDDNGVAQEHGFGLLEKVTEIDTFSSLRNGCNGISLSSLQSNEDDDDDDDDFCHLSDDDSSQVKQVVHKPFESGTTITFGDGKYDDDDDDEEEEEKEENSDISFAAATTFTQKAGTGNSSFDAPKASSHHRKISGFNPNSQKFVPRHFGTTTSKGSEGTAEQKPAAAPGEIDNKLLKGKNLQLLFGKSSSATAKVPTSAPVQVPAAQGPKKGTQGIFENRSLSSSPGSGSPSLPGDANNFKVFSFFANGARTSASSSNGSIFGTGENTLFNKK